MKSNGRVQEHSLLYCTELLDKLLTKFWVCANYTVSKLLNFARLRPMFQQIVGPGVPAGQNKRNVRMLPAALF